MQTCIGVRANIHGERKLFEADHIRWGGGAVPEMSYDLQKRTRLGGGGVLPAETYPKFMLIEHVLCFARIMSNLCPN